MNSILSSTIYPKSENYSSNLPDNFDWKLYASIVKDSSINSGSSAYKHYKHKCTVNSHNYRLYWRTYYKIPNNFVEESYKKYLNFSSVKFQFNNFEDLYKFYVTKGAQLYPLNDKYSRIHFEIPDDFDAKIYITVYPEAKKENDNQIYHFYHYNKESFPLNAYYYRLKYNIPEDFDISVYNQRYNFSYNEDTAYQFYKNIGQYSYPLDDTYYRLKYNIPQDFDIQVYNNRYNFNYNITNAYQFYKNIGQYSYPLDDLYYRVKYNIPQDFDIQIYNKRYNLNHNLTNGYQFYKNIGQNSYPLDDTYYRILYDIPNEFDLDLYKKKYNIDLSPIETYIFYSKNIHCRNLEPDNVNEICNIDSDIIDSDIIDSDIIDSDIDSNNVKTILKIPENFNYETYNLRYQLDLNEIECYKFYKENCIKHPLDDPYYTLLYKTPSNLTNKYLETFKILYPNKIKPNHTMKDALNYYSNTLNNYIKEKPLSSNDIEKYNHIFELIDPNIIYKDDVFFYDFINSNTKLTNIYNVYLKYPNSELAIKFIKNYEYLNNFKDYFCSEESKINYFLIKDFADEYFNESNILIEKKSYFPVIQTITKTKMVTKKKHINNNSEYDKLPINSIMNNNPIMEESINYQDNKVHKFYLLQIMELMKQQKEEKEKEQVENDDEDVEEEESYTEDIATYPTVNIPLYTTFYYNLEKEHKKYNYFDIYRNIQRCQNFYNILKQQKTIIDSFSKYTPKYVNKKDKDNYCAVVFLNDNYIHNYLSILNNLMKLSKVSNLYIFTNKNIENTKQFNFYHDLISKKFEITKININNKFTFNDYNNLILDPSFWKNFNSEYIILFSTLTFLKTDLFLNDITKFNKYYVSNNIINSNNSSATLFSIRSKKYMMDLLKELNNEDTIDDFNSQINISLNIDRPIETFLFHNFINKNILLNYLENMESSFNYFDLECNLIDIISNMR
jgi:hypothetical protein